MKRIQIKRVYEPSEKTDGFRVLVDRVWPRGLTKSDAAVDLWMKEVAPSTKLRKWFNHDPARWNVFQEKYRAELREHNSELEELKAYAEKRRLTLVYSARDTEHNQALALLGVLQGK
jgi:uncharacterized protein YeaO (DUF488 family)